MAIRLAAFAKNGVNPNYRAFLRGVERAAAAEGATATRHLPATPDDPAQQIALLAGDIDCFVGDISLALEHVRAGTIRVIGVTTQARAPLLPEAPAVGEIVPGFVAPFWFGLFAAKQTAPEAIRRMNAELSPLGAPGSQVSRRMAERGSKVLLTGPEPRTARLRAEVAQWRQVVQAAGITPE